MLAGWLVSGSISALAGAASDGLDLPRPSGASPVGTTVAYLRDGARSDATFAQGRPVTLQLWYPAASAPSGGSCAAYLMEPELAGVLAEQGYYEVDAETLRAWKTLPTHSWLDVAPKEGAHPLVTFSVGLGVARANYTSIAEELASHGLVVALVESPFAGVMLRPDGGLIQATSPELETPAGHRAAVDEWARDIGFVLDSLEERRVEGAAAAVAAHVDWKRVAAMGHSSGGLVALQAGALDARVIAGIDLDGGFVSPADEPIASFVTPGIAKPALVLRMNPRYSEADLERRGRTREQWEALGAAMRARHEALAARSSAPTTFTRVAGTAHLSFSDAPYTMPSAITRFGGDILPAQRNLLVITGAVRAFLADAFAGRPGVDFDAALERFPELELEFRSPGTR